MNTSEQTKDVVPALVALRVNLTMPVKDAKGAERGGRKIPYLSLQALLEHIGTPCREAMVVPLQEINGDLQSVGVTTYMVHVSGQWVAFGPAIFPAPSDPQQRGAVISYARRYSLLAALGLAAEDDDAQSATSSPASGGRDGVTDGNRATAVEVGEASAERAAPDGGGAPAPPPDLSRDKARSMMEFHPGKPHRMVPSPTVPDLLTCAQDSPAQYGCAYVEAA